MGGGRTDSDERSAACSSTSLAVAAISHRLCAHRPTFPSHRSRITCAPIDDQPCPLGDLASPVSLSTCLAVAAISHRLCAYRPTSPFSPISHRLCAHRPAFPSHLSHIALAPIDLPRLPVTLHPQLNGIDPYLRRPRATSPVPPSVRTYGICFISLFYLHYIVIQCFLL
jgi:hypothetical protein